MTSKAKPEGGLHYVDHNGAYLSGVPARDLTEADIARLAVASGQTEADARAALIASGLYGPESEEKSDG